MHFNDILLKLWERDNTNRCFQLNNVSRVLKNEQQFLHGHAKLKLKTLYVSILYFMLFCFNSSLYFHNRFYRSSFSTAVENLSQESDHFSSCLLRQFIGDDSTSHEETFVTEF